MKDGGARRGSFLRLEERVNRTISPDDRLYPRYPGAMYFRRGLRQLDAIDALLRAHGSRRLRRCGSIADFACHYGRLLRCLRVALPRTSLYAYDLDPAAVGFCAREFGCVPVVTSWQPREAEVTATHDLVISLSLVTHTRLSFFRDVLELWERMLEPGGFLFFTYLGERYLEEWAEGRLAYDVVDADAARAAVEEFHRNGHVFCGRKTAYSATDDYGIAFIQDSVVAEEIARRPSLRLLELASPSGASFGQDLAVVRKARWGGRLLPWRRRR